MTIFELIGIITCLSIPTGIFVYIREEETKRMEKSLALQLKEFNEKHERFPCKYVRSPNMTEMTCLDERIKKLIKWETTCSKNCEKWRTPTKEEIKKFRGKVKDIFQGKTKSCQDACRRTARNRKIKELVKEGWSDKEIAEEFEMSESHVAKIRLGIMGVNK